MFDHFKRSFSRENLPLWGSCFLLAEFLCLYYRKYYLPFFHLSHPAAKLIVCTLAAAAFMVLLAQVLARLVKRLGPVRPGMLGLSALYLILFVLLFYSHWQIVPTPPTKLLLWLLSLANCYVLLWGLGKPRMAKYRRPSGVVAAGVISLYASLASFGQRFFLDGNTRMHFSGEGAFYCILGALWFLPLVFLGLHLLEVLSERAGRKQPPLGSRRKSWWILFGCLALTQGVIFWILWPGAFPNDAYNQLRGAIGLTELNDWHPVLYTLIMRLIMAVFRNAAMIVACQMVCVVWLLTAYLMLGWDRGVPLKWLCLFGAVFLLLPNQALSWSNAMKDYPFTLALLWGTYLLLQLVSRHPWTKKGSFWLCLSLDMFLIAGLRHNGILPFGVLGVMCLLLTLRRFSQVRFRALAAFLASLTALVIFKGPVYTALDVVPNIQSTYTSMLCAVGSYINKDLPLSPEAEEIMETVIPLEDWADYYSRFEGHDVYYWGRSEGSVEYDTSQIHAGNAFRVYLEALFKAPDVIIKDRLDGMDILWDVVQPEDSFNGNAFHYIFTYDTPLDCIPMEDMHTEDGQHFYKQTPLAQRYYDTTFTDLHGAFNMLVWRTGPYLIALLVLLLFWWKNRLNRLWLAAIPLMSNLFASILILYHQSFRYVYFVQLLTLVLLFATVLMKQELATQTTVQEGATIE